MTGNRIWILGASLVIAGIVALGWLLGISPKLAEGDAALASREAVEQQNAQQEAVLGVLEQQFEQLDELKVQLEALEAELPNKPEVEEFIGYVTEAAAQSGVVISTITAVEPTDYGQTGDGTAPPAQAPVDPPADPPAEGADPVAPPEGESATPVTPAEGTWLFSVGVTIEVEGSAEQVMAFSKRLQESKRIFLNSQVVITSGGQGILGGSVAGYLFVLDPIAAADPTAAAG